MPDSTPTPEDTDSDVGRLSRALLFDPDDTILAAGRRPQVLLTVAQEFAAELEPLTPSDVADSLEAALEAFWSDSVRHKTARFGISEARRKVISDTFAVRGAEHLTRDLAERFEAASQPIEKN